MVVTLCDSKMTKQGCPQTDGNMIDNEAVGLKDWGKLQKGLLETDGPADRNRTCI